MYALKATKAKFSLFRFILVIFFPLNWALTESWHLETRPQPSSSGSWTW